MGQERESEERRLIFRHYAVNRDLLAAARPDVIVLHCLPAHRGEEITADVIDGEASRRVGAGREPAAHVQKALLAFLLAMTETEVRRSAIRALVDRYPVSSQEDLVELLRTEHAIDGVAADGQP